MSEIYITAGLQGSEARLEGLDCHLVVKMCITVESEGPHIDCPSLSHSPHDKSASDILCHAPIS